MRLLNLKTTKNHLIFTEHSKEMDFTSQNDSFGINLKNFGLKATMD